MYRELRLRARILSVRRELTLGLGQGLPRPQDRRLLHRGLPRLPDHQGRGGDARRSARSLQASGIPVENSKGEWGPGQEEINVRYADALTMADRHVGHEECDARKSRICQGKAITFMAKWDYGLAGSSSHIHMSLGARRARTAFLDPKARTRHVAADAATSSPAAHLRHATSPISSRPTSIPTSASRRAPSRRPRRSGAATTAPPASASAATARRASGSSAASAAPTSIPISPIAGADRRRAQGDRGKTRSSRPAITGDAYLGKKLREVPKTLRGAIDALRKSKMLRDALGEQVVDPLRPHRRVGAVRIRPPGDRLGVEARLRAVVRRCGRAIRQVNGMTETVKIISPVDGWVYAERPVASAAEIEAAVVTRRSGAGGPGRGHGCRAGEVPGAFPRCAARQERRDRPGTGLADGPAGALRRRKSAASRSGRAT